MPLDNFLPCVEQSAPTLIERARELTDDFEEMEIESKTASILDHVCKDLKTAKLLYAVWCERF